MRIGDKQSAVIGGLTHHRERTTLARTQRLEQRQAVRRNRQHIALLRLVTPDLARRHARLFALRRTQIDARTPATGMRQLRQRIRQATSTNVMNRQQRVVFAQLPATINHFLGASLHLGIAPLHRIEIQIGRVGPGIHAGGGTTTHTDEHARATQLHQQRARWQVVLVGVPVIDAADASGQHDGLVIAAQHTVDLLLEAAKVTAQVGTTKFVVEGGRANRALEHHRQRRHNAIGLLLRGLPGLRPVRQTQVGDRKAAQSGLGLGTATGGAFIADLATRAGGSTGKRRDGGGMVVRLALHQRVGQTRPGAIATLGIGREAARHAALHDGGVIGIRHYRTQRLMAMRLADHAEQGFAARLPVDDPVGIENLVPAMLRVGLGEHGQLDIGRITTGADINIQQVIDFISSQCQTQTRIGLYQRIAPLPTQRNQGQRTGGLLHKQLRQVAGIGEQAFGHAVVQRRLQRSDTGRRAVHTLDHIAQHALDTRQSG